MSEEALRVKMCRGCEVYGPDFHVLNAVKTEGDDALSLQILTDHIPSIAILLYYIRSETVGARLLRTELLILDARLQLLRAGGEQGMKKSTASIRAHTLKTNHFVRALLRVGS